MSQIINDIKKLIHHSKGGKVSVLDLQISLYKEDIRIKKINNEMHSKELERESNLVLKGEICEIHRTWKRPSNFFGANTRFCPKCFPGIR